MLKQHRCFSGKMLACHAGGPGSIPGRCSSIFGIWREVLGRNVYITSQNFFPAIIYRDIISHITITYRHLMYFFRTFKKSIAPYKVHNMGLRYIKYAIVINGTAYAVSFSFHHTSFIKKLTKLAQKCCTFQLSRTLLFIFSHSGTAQWHQPESVPNSTG
jgi:hypothetical protein